MSISVIDLECPGCGKPITIETKQCPQCFREIIISTFNSLDEISSAEINRLANGYRKNLNNKPENVELNASIAYCYLKLKLFEKAIPHFEKAIEDNFDNSDLFFYLAVALLKGKRPFLVSRDCIKKAEEYIQAAIMIEPKGIYYYLWSYIRFDHHYKKMFKMTPDYKELMLMAEDAGVSDCDISSLCRILGIDKIF